MGRTERFSLNARPLCGMTHSCSPLRAALQQSVCCGSAGGGTLSSVRRVHRHAGAGTGSLLWGAGSPVLPVGPPAQRSPRAAAAREEQDPLTEKGEVGTGSGALDAWFRSVLPRASWTACGTAVLFHLEINTHRAVFGGEWRCRGGAAAPRAGCGVNVGPCGTRCRAAAAPRRGCCPPGWPFGDKSPQTVFRLGSRSRSSPGCSVRAPSPRAGGSGLLVS